MAKMFYTLEIKSSNSYGVMQIMGIGECSNDQNYQYRIVDGDDPLDIEEDYVLEHYLNLLEKHKESLLRIDDKHTITLWMTYEYDDQCNMEFPTEHVRRMADLNVYLCISAYQYDEGQDNWDVKNIE